MVRLTQEESFHAAGYQGERIRNIFLNSDVDYRHFYLEGTLNRGKVLIQLNQRYLRGAMKTGCRAILNCVKAAGATVQDVDFLAVCHEAMRRYPQTVSLPHMFYDTFAIELLLAGIPIDQVSVLLGHRSVKMTEKHYLPWMKARKKQLTAGLQRAWFPEVRTVTATRKLHPE